MDGNPDLIVPGNAMDFISDDGGNTYNRCHCESSPLCSWRTQNDKHLSVVWSNCEFILDRYASI